MERASQHPDGAIGTGGWGSPLYQGALWPCFLVVHTSRLCFAGTPRSLW